MATNLSRAQLRRAVFTHAGAVADRQHVTRVLGNLFLAIEICWIFGYDEGVHISFSTLPADSDDRAQAFQYFDAHAFRLIDARVSGVVGSIFKA